MIKKDFTLSSFAKTVKKYVRNNQEYSGDYFNNLLAPLVKAGNVKNKLGDELFLDKTRVSRIIQQKDDPPTALVDCLTQDGIHSRTAGEFTTYIKGNIPTEFKISLANDLAQLISQAMNLDESKKQNVLAHRDELPVFLAESLILSIATRNKVIANEKTILTHGSNKVSVLEGDLFRYGFDNRKKARNIVVIPVNTSFETHVSRKIEGETFPLVSENTIHGQWLIRWEQAGNRIADLDSRITAGIKSQGIEADHISESLSGKNLCYPIGTTVVIESTNAIYFLLALSEFDRKNIARSNRGNIDAAITSLLCFYDQFGQGYDLYMPLVGTGRSRSGLDLQESFDLLTQNLRKNILYVQGNIHIVLDPSWSSQIDIQEEK